MKSEGRGFESLIGRIVLAAFFNCCVFSWAWQVWAYDGGEPSNAGYIDVIIVVQDSNDNPPVFVNSTYYVTLPEDHQLGTPFLVVSF